MIVFDLQCAQGGHVFETWFNSSSAYDDQKIRGLLMCPLCQDTDISKAVMAPAVPKKGNSQSLRAPMAVPSTMMTDPASVDVSDANRIAAMREMLGKVAEMQAETLKTSKWVGQDFERQARAMDAGDVPTESIHGQTTPDQARAMVEDGIGVMPLLVPVIPPDKRN
jgi:hypothetical protein